MAASRSMRRWIFKRIDFPRPSRSFTGSGAVNRACCQVEPYKSEILPHWRFRTPEIARESSEKILALYEGYKAAGEFVGMDMARKFLQMGYTRARRYANHRGGRKYSPARVRCSPMQMTKPRPKRRCFSARNGKRSKPTRSMCGCWQSIGVELTPAARVTPQSPQRKNPRGRSPRPTRRSTRSTHPRRRHGRW